MPTVKLNAKTLAKLKAPDPSGHQQLYWDADLKGFGILLSGVTNARTYVVQTGLRDGSGRRPRVTVGPVNVLDLDDARGRAEKIIAAMLLGRDPKTKDGESTTLREALDAYLAGNGELREKSRKDYRGTVERWLASWLDKPLRTIGDDAIVARLQDIAEEVAAGGRYGGNATANAAIRAMRAIWNDAAMRDKGLAPWPTARLRRKWHHVPRRERLVRADDLPKWHAAVLALPNPIHRDYLLTLLYSGLRRSEAAGLGWNDVDFAQKVIRIPAERTKSGRRRFDVPMTDLLRDLLVARRSIGKAKFIFAADSASGHLVEPRFPLDLVAQASGVTVSAHDLRRTYISVAERSGISPMELKALVNHSLGDDVTAGYVVIEPEQLRAAAQKVADRMKELCKIERPVGVEKLGA